MYMDVQTPRVLFRRVQMLKGPQGARRMYVQRCWEPLCGCVSLPGRACGHLLSAIINNSHSE